MEQDVAANVPVADNTKAEKGNSLKLALIITSLLAICGIGFGVYEFLDNSNKANQIQDLQKQIDSLRADTPTTTNAENKIKIISSSWSGWSEDYEPEETESYCELKLNEKCVVKTIQISDSAGNQREEEVLSFEITEITDDSVSIHTYQVFSDNEEGIDLYSTKQDFVIKNNESLELTTPTMDEGDIFTLSLLR